jgi:hypothetical protein
MTPLAGRLTQKVNLPQHLRELSQLVGRKEEPEELLSLAETEAVRAQAMTVQRLPSWRCELRFSDKRSARFGRLLQAIRERNPSPVYLWTPLSNDCGLLRPVPLSDVQFDFDFAVNKDGILELLTADFQDRMLLDFSGPDSERLLAVEVAGANWGQVVY